MRQVRERHILNVVSYSWNLKIKQKNEYNKMETNSQIKRTNQWLTMRRRKGKGKTGVLYSERESTCIK